MGGWKTTYNKLEKEFTFQDFTEALALVNKVGMVAEELNHHPDIFLTYGKVKITTWTHSTNSITEKDHQLTEKIDQLSLQTPLDTPESE